MRAHSSASSNGAALNGAWIRKASWLAIMALMAVTLVIGVGQPAQGGLPGETTTMPPVECDDNKAPDDPRTIIQKGDRLQIVGDNGPNMVRAMAGDSQAGEVAVMTDWSGGTINFSDVHRVQVWTCMGDDVVDFTDLDFSDGPHHIDTGEGDDTVTGSPLRDIIRTGDGSDTIDGGDGNDNINAGGGDDRDVGGGEGNDNVKGGSGDDIVDGGPGDDKVSGGSGDDRVRGGPDDDKLLGQSGDDLLNGNEGFDNYNCGSGKNDVAVDAEVGEPVKKCEGTGSM